VAGNRCGRTARRRRPTRRRRRWCWPTRRRRSTDGRGRGARARSAGWRGRRSAIPWVLLPPVLSVLLPALLRLRAEILVWLLRGLSVLWVRVLRLPIRVLSAIPLLLLRLSVWIPVWVRVPVCGVVCVPRRLWKRLRRGVHRRANSGSAPERGSVRRWQQR